jgi:hypothetical protein
MAAAIMTVSFYASVPRVLDIPGRASPTASLGSPVVGWRRSRGFNRHSNRYQQLSPP